MLTEELKQEIQAAYTQLLDARGFRARYCQRLMIAEIARTIGGIDDGADDEPANVAVIEAGTGTGKTIAYVLAALPIAQALDKKLIISTATISLQEQIVNRDLPDIFASSGLEFSWAIAKGRRRYLCLARMDQVLKQGSETMNLAFFEDEVAAASVDESFQQTYESMIEELIAGRWDGERDSWPDDVDDQAWNSVSTDHIRCTGRQCSHYDSCLFYQARADIHRVDCIVTNHDLVLSDLMAGGGHVLPDPEASIYIFDEGHHLPQKAINHLAKMMGLSSTNQWLAQVPEVSRRLVAELGAIGGLPRAQAEIEQLVTDVSFRFSAFEPLLESFKSQSTVSEQGSQYRFELGQVAPELREEAAQAVEVMQRLDGQLNRLISALSERVEGDEPALRELGETWLATVSGLLARCEAALALLQSFATERDQRHLPVAHWIKFNDYDTQLLASPIAVSEVLGEMLWSRAYGCVVTSATLSVGGDFGSFSRRAGIGHHNTFTRLPSPFDFSKQAVLAVPDMSVDPRDVEAHTQEMAQRLPVLLAGDPAALVLFSSWRQLFAVDDLLDEDFRERVLKQGEYSRSEIVRRHRERVDAGQASCIFGLASFAEGVDLPGRYCDHVVIAKIPFAVPDDPVGATLSEWIAASGGDSFREVMIPDAALRLVQACGRLLRTEEDTGRITILDRRLRTQRYGKTLLDALPPFHRDFSPR